MISWKLGWDQTLNTWLHWLFRRTPSSSLSLLGQSEEGGDDAHVEVVCPDAHDVVQDTRHLPEQDADVLGPQKLPDGQSLAALLYSISFCVPLWSRLMWGSALVTVWNTILSLSSSLHQSSAHLSSSSWNTSLKTPWAAGCWGPNLSWNYIVDVQYLTTLLFTCKLLRLGQPASVGHQLGFVLLLGEEEVLLFVLASVISQDGLWNVDVLPPGGLHVH